MSNKKIIAGSIIAFIVVCTIIYVLYINAENEKLEDENKKLKDAKVSPEIIRLEDITDEKLIEEFEELISPKNPKKLSYEETLRCVLHLKKVIEDRDGYRIFHQDGVIKREKDVHILLDLTFANSRFDINKEVNNGRGAVDFKVSLGKDQTLVEVKLASNTRLKANLQKQVNIYANANNHPKKIIVIMFFNAKEQNKLNKLFGELNLDYTENIVLIDARSDNKISASLANNDNQLLNNLSLN